MAGLGMSSVYEPSMHWNLFLVQGLSEEEVQAAARAAAADAAQASDLVNRTSGAADAQERYD